MPSDSVFYARIDSLPLLPQSATYTANMGSTVSLTFDSGMGVTVADSSTPTFNAHFYYTPQYNSPNWVLPPPTQIHRESGALSADNNDHHSITVQRQTCQVYDLYHEYITPSGSVVPSTCAGKPCNAQSGYTYSSGAYTIGSASSDAAGLPLLPLIWTAHEIMDGQITHPMRFTEARGYIQVGNPYWPATGTNGWGSTSTPPYGTRFRLQAAFAPSLTGLTAQQAAYANTIIKGLKQYGLVLADIGTTMNTAVDDEVSQNPDIIAALNKIGPQIHSGNLEAVDLSSIQVSSTSYQASSLLPSQPVLVGTPYGSYLNIQAGVSGYPLQSWVNGSANQAVTWSVLSGSVGTITPQGQYTPPASVSGIVQGVLQVASQADPSSVTTLYVRVFPAGPIRIFAGSQTASVTDKLGQTWLPDLFFRGGDTVRHAGDYPAWPTPSDPSQAAELAVYEGEAYTYGNDFVANLIVANGNYTVHWLLGEEYNPGQTAGACNAWFQGIAPYRQHYDYEAQYQIGYHDFNFGAAVNYQCAVPNDLYIPAQVTDNSLELAIRNATPPGTSKASDPIFSGVEITPNSSAPHLMIDSDAQQSTVAPGSSLQMYAVGWYMPNSVTWSLAGGPGTISSTGLYTAPASVPSTTTVVILAKSTCNPGVSTSTVLNIP